MADNWPDAQRLAPASFAVLEELLTVLVDKCVVAESEVDAILERAQARLAAGEFTDEKRAAIFLERRRQGQRWRRRAAESE